MSIKKDIKKYFVRAQILLLMAAINVKIAKIYLLAATYITKWPLNIHPKTIRKLIC